MAWSIARSRSKLMVDISFSKSIVIIQ